MERTRYLSESEKSAGLKALYQSEIYNGIGFSMLGDTIVYILAVRFGAGNLALGYIASAMYIVGVLLPIMPRLLSGRNTSKVQSLVWLIRGLVSLGYIPLLFLEGNSAVALLLVVYTLFSCARLAGVVLYDYTVKMLSTSKNRGKVLSTMNMIFQGSTIAAKFITFLVTSIKRFATIGTFVGMQMIGVVSNTIAAVYLGRIPSRSVIEYRKGRTLGVLFKESIAKAEIRIRLILFWIFTAVTVVMGMTVPFLSKVAAFSPSMVFLFSVSSGAAVVLSGRFCKFFGDRMGSRPLIIWNSSILVLFIFIWMILPADSPKFVILIFGALLNFFLGVVNILIRRLTASVIPDNEGVAFNSMVNFVVALIAFVAGLAGGALATVGQHIPHSFHVGSVHLGNTYFYTFSSALILAVVGNVLAVRLKEKGSMTNRGAAQILFSLHGLRAFMDIDKLERVTDPVKRKTLLLSLGANLTGVATSEIRNTLASPFSDDKVEVIRGLYDRPRPELVDDLIKDAFDTDSYTQIDSIFALGALIHNEKAERALAYLLEHGTIMVRSTAAKSLARVTRNARYLTRVADLSDQAVNTMEELNFLIARNIMDTEGSFFSELFIPAKKGMSVTFRQTHYAVLAHFLKFRPSLSELFEQKNLGNNEFMIEFLEEARDVAEIDEQYDGLARAFTSKEWSRVWSICYPMVRSLTFKSSRLRYLHAGVMESQAMPRSQIDGDDTLAVLYFSYQLKKQSV